MLNLEMLNKIVSTPKVIQKKQVTLIKSSKNNDVLEGTASQRSEQATKLVIDALQINQPACARDLSIVTRLTVSCVRDKLNMLFDAGKATKKPIKSNRTKTFYFSVVA